MTTPRRQAPVEPTELLFPTRGLDRSTEYDRQPPATTGVGINVRPYDHLQRARGGSRPGLFAYLAEQIPEGEVLIQHLAAFTDPTHDAVIRIGRKPRPDLPDLPDFPEIPLPPYDDYVVFDDVLWPKAAFLSAHSEFVEVTDSDGSTIIIRDGGGGRSQRRPALRRHLLIITPDDANKALNTTKTFAGTEFTTTNLQGGDSVTSVEMDSTGAPRDASLGPYPIRVKKTNVVRRITPPAATIGRSGALTADLRRRIARGDPSAMLAAMALGATSTGGSSEETGGEPILTGTTASGIPINRKYRVIAEEGTLTVGQMLFVQAKNRHVQNQDNTLPDYSAAFFTPVDVVFDSNVTAGNLIVVFLTTEINDTITITDNFGTTYTEVSITGHRLRVWTGIAAGSGACTVSGNFTTYQFINLAILEYSGTDATTPVDNVADLIDTGLSTRTITVNNSGSLTIGFFSDVFFLDDVMTWTPPSGGYNTRIDATLYPCMLIVDKLAVAAGSVVIGPVAGTFSISGPTTDVRSVGLAIKPPA